MKSCTPAELAVPGKSKKDKLRGYEVILEDTILFPEGGGQVCRRYIKNKLAGRTGIDKTFLSQQLLVEINFL